jgi:DNA-binding CsgD family transcriptional regulator
LIYQQTNINKALIEPYNGGIKLISPMKKSAVPLIKTIDFLLKLPMSFYLLDSEGQTLIINEEGATVCGYASVEQSIGKSILAVGEKESAQQLIDNCREVLTLNSVKIFDEKYIRKDGNQQQFLSVKCPWYDQNDKINGICGFSIVLGQHSLANSLSFITQLNLLNQLSSVHQEMFNFKRALTSQLTKREMDCLHLTVKGFTAKRIARELNISFRTVEEYLANIRIKLGATSKSQLIEMVLE